VRRDREAAVEAGAHAAAGFPFALLRPQRAARLEAARRLPRAAMATGGFAGAGAGSGFATAVAITGAAGGGDVQATSAGAGASWSHSGARPGSIWKVLL
jgi:hypothetical protein